MTKRFKYVDGRVVEAGTAIGFFEKLIEGECVPPPTLARYLDLIHSRALLCFGVDLDVGPASADTATRCRRALGSLIEHGWVRLVGQRSRRSPLGQGA